MAFLGTDTHAISLPKVALTAFDFGGVLVVPAVTIEAKDADGRAELTLPLASLLIEGAHGSTGVLTKSVPAITLTATGLTGFVAALDDNFPAPTLIASGYTGFASEANLILPAIRTTGYGYAHIDVSLAVPIVGLTADGAETPIYDVSITVPVVTLEASIDPQPRYYDATDYAVWVMNHTTGAHSNYTNWQVNSYGKFNGVELILLNDGIYEMTGTTDAGTNIDEKVEWVKTDFGTHKQKRVDSLAINMRSLNQDYFAITFVVDEQQNRRYLKDVRTRPEGMRRHRLLVPKGLNGHNWGFGVENVSGGEFVLDDIEVIAQELIRRFK